MGKRLVILASAIFFAWTGTALAGLHMSDLTVDRIQSTVGDANASQIHIEGTVTQAVLSNYSVWIRYTFDVSESCSDGVLHSARLDTFANNVTSYTTNASTPGTWTADILFRAGPFNPNGPYPSICGSSAYPTGPMTILAVHLSVYAGPFSPPPTDEGTPLYYGFDIPAGTWSYSSGGDTTPPQITHTISPASPDGANGWYVTAPTVSFTCTDNVALVSCTGPVTLGEGRQYAFGWAFDTSGNSNEDVVGPLFVDLSNPVVTCAATQQLLLNGTGTVTASVTDAVSGAATPTVAAAASTSRVGSFTATLTGSDRAGRTTTASCPYTVSYGVRVTDDRLQLTDAAGRDVSSRSITLRVSTVDGVSVPSAQLAMRGSPSNGWYVLQHDRFVAKGTHVLEFLAGDDPVVHRVTLRVK